MPFRRSSSRILRRPSRIAVRACPHQKSLILIAGKGLKAAITRILGATWQRCRVHFMRNLLSHARKQGRRVVSALVAEDTRGS